MRSLLDRRARMKDPRILILDEATSALDAESEEAVQSALETLMRRRTAFVIAHRLSTVINPDRILVLKEGRVIELGPRAELVRRGGYYTSLMHRQHRGLIPEDDAAIGRATLAAPPLGAVP